jgi:regulator of replication initiation timing
MDISSNCKCKYKAYVLACCRCHKIASLSETESKENKLNEMKKRLQKLISEQTILRIEIKELEDDILD